MLLEKRMKVPNGKLLIVKAEVEGGSIRRVFIEGDFFLHPEDNLEMLEDVCATTALEGLKDELDSVIREFNIMLVGIDTDSIVKLMHEIYGEIKS